MAFSAQQRKALQHRCHQRLSQLLDQIDLTQVADVFQFVESVAQLRRRSILLLAFHMPRSLTGLWVCSPEQDVIFYAQDLPDFLRDQAISHEMGHLLCAHNASLQLSPAVLSAFKFVSAEYIEETLGVLARSQYDSEQEFEAEYFASLLEQTLAVTRSSLGMVGKGVSGDERVRARLESWVRLLRQD